MESQNSSGGGSVQDPVSAQHFSGWTSQPSYIREHRETPSVALVLSILCRFVTSERSLRSAKKLFNLLFARQLPLK